MTIGEAEQCFSTWTHIQIQTKYNLKKGPLYGLSMYLFGKQLLMTPNFSELVNDHFAGESEGLTHFQKQIKYV